MIRKLIEKARTPVQRVGLILTSLSFGAILFTAIHWNSRVEWFLYSGYSGAETPAPKPAPESRGVWLREPGRGGWSLIRNACVSYTSERTVDTEAVSNAIHAEITADIILEGHARQGISSRISDKPGVIDRLKKMQKKCRIDFVADIRERVLGVSVGHYLQSLVGEARRPKAKFNNFVSGYYSNTYMPYSGMALTTLAVGFAMFIGWIEALLSWVRFGKLGQ